MIPNRILKVVLHLLLLLACFNSYGATPNDSLREKDYKYLFSMIRKLKDRPDRQVIYQKAFLSNAKADKDWELIVRGYKNYADCAEGNLAITYSDSMVYAARKSNDDKLIGSAYLSRGVVYYVLKRHGMALENYLLARPFIEKSNDDYLRYKLKYNIAQEKYYLGKNDEAIRIFNSCLDFFKSNNARAYLNTLHSLGLCYSHAKNYGKSEAMVKLGLSEASRLDDHSMDCYFFHLDGQNEYFLKNYTLSIKKLTEAIPGVADNDDYANVAVANFYIGKSYWDMKQYEEGVAYFHKVADVFEQKDYIRPDLRENFELLIQYYKGKNDSKQVLLYVDQLLKADSLLLGTHDNLYDNIHRNYDTKELLQEKLDIQKELSNEISNKKIVIIGATLIISVAVILLTLYERNRRRQNRIFRELLLEKKPEKPLPAKRMPKELGIAPETVEKILNRLEKWEQSKRYLDTDITRTTLAVYLETNVHYASDVIMHYRDKSFTEYVNDLKVDYIIEQLKTDKHKRMFTHDALAEEAGFSTTQRFVQAFKARTTLSPNFFSAKIRKEMAEA
jgi:tetratricopeptide (TPR) repeat protein